MTINKELDLFVKAVRDVTGIVLSSENKHLIEKRYRDFLRVFEVSSFNPNLLNSQNIHRFIDIVTNNESSFFRDIYPFEVLENLSFEKKQVNVLSIPSSKGQEPISILMSLESNQTIDNYEINAFDIDQVALEYFRNEGFFEFEIKRGLDDVKIIDEYFDKVDKKYKLSNKYENKIKTKVLNILKDNLDNDHYDVIFCRNLLFYFDEKSRELAIQKIVDGARNGAFLFVGNSEKFLHSSLVEQKYKGHIYYQVNK